MWLTGDKREWTHLRGMETGEGLPQKETTTQGAEGPQLETSKGTKTQSCTKGFCQAPKRAWKRTLSQTFQTKAPTS